jgi:hypothetical protein
VLKKENTKAIVPEIPSYPVQATEEKILERKPGERKVDGKCDKPITRIEDLPH